MSLLLLFVLGSRLVLALRHYRIKKRYTAALEAPSVTVCIPARNEMHALAECLERVLASTYPKLEIIVLDDDSQDDTSIIIKSFAHAGVRFVGTSDLPEGWLGKNYALDTLARQASGTFVMFMDVDTFIQPTTISELVGCLMTEQKDMVSVIPRRNDVGRVSVLFGTLRYFWQLTMSSTKRVAASSSLWLIKRDVLLGSLQTLEAVKTDVELETLIGSSMNQQYMCLVGTQEVGVSYEKKWRSQVETSIRLLSPLFSQVFGGFVGFFFLIILNAPVISMFLGIFIGWGTLQTFAVMILCLYIGVYGLYLRAVWQCFWWVGMFLWPYVIAQELIILCLSAWAYERRAVTWKNRSITAAKS